VSESVADGSGGDVVQNRSLPDADLTPDDEYPAAALARTFENLVEKSAFVAPAEQHLSSSPCDPQRTHG
jgi:hypothetical protein